MITSTPLLESDDLFEKNYNIVLEKQYKLIKSCETVLSKDDTSDVEKKQALKHLGNMMWLSTTARKLLGTATHLWWIYLRSEFFNIHLLTPQQFENRYSLKFNTCVKMYSIYEKEFLARDELVLKLLKQHNSSSYILPSVLKQHKLYWPNHVKTVDMWTVSKEIDWI